MKGGLEMTNDYFYRMVIDEAKNALNASGVSDEQVESVVAEYLDENPACTTTALIIDNILVVK